MNHERLNNPCNLGKAVPAATKPAERDASGGTVRLFGARFSTSRAPEVIAAVETGPRTRPRLIVTANIDHIVILSENPAFRKAYEGAAARTLDGTPLVWLARLSGRREIPRVTGHDLLAAALAMPQPDARRVFLVSSSDAVGAKVAARFVDAGLAPADVETVSPPFGFEADEMYSARLAARIRAHGTTVLVLGVGAPKSEIWVDRQGNRLGAPLVLAVGEALDVAAGLVPRAPVPIQRLGLEWLFRFAHAPRRLFGRYFLRSWRFLWIVARSGAPSGLGRAMQHGERDAHRHERTDVKTADDRRAAPDSLWTRS